MTASFVLRILPSVTREAHRIYTYRNKDQGKAAADRFTKALNECYDDVLSNPYGHQVRRPPFRHAFLRRLKFRVVYKVEGPYVTIVQVRHTSRKPSKKFGP